MPLDTSPRIADPDALFALLVEAHAGLDEAASRRLDARLVLLLMNHIGDEAVLREAIRLAREAGDSPPAPPAPAAAPQAAAPQA